MSALPDTRASVDPTAIARLRDRYGVLTVYVDADPREQAAARPAWVVAAENGLDEIRRRVRNEGDRERWRAVASALDSLEGELAAILDPRLPGRGRALFATVGGGEVLRVAIQLPLVDRVVLDDVADLTPLLVAWDRGRPAGLVVVSHESVRVLETALGAVEDIAAFDVEPETSDWRELKGPAAANPGLAQHAASQRDRFERRVEEHVERQLERVAAELERTCARRGWDRLVISGDPRLTQALRDGLERDHVDLALVDRRLNGLSAAEIADALAPELEAAHARREASLVGRARDAALSGNAGALGLADVVAALEDGRVDHVLFDPERPFPGVQAADGRLAPADEVPPGADPSELVAEPSLAPHLVERALATDARVTPLSAAGAQALAEHGGIAAVLRW